MKIVLFIGVLGILFIILIIFLAKINLMVGAAVFKTLELAELHPETNGWLNIEEILLETKKALPPSFYLTKSEYITQREILTVLKQGIEIGLVKVAKIQLMPLPLMDKLTGGHIAMISQVLYKLKPSKEEREA